MFRNVLVKFGASWCNPCNQAENFLAEKFQPTQYASIDVSENEEIAKQYNVRNVPTFIQFDSEGNEVQRFTGYNPTKITQAINSI